LSRVFVERCRAQWNAMLCNVVEVFSESILISSRWVVGKLQICGDDDGKVTSKQQPRETTRNHMNMFTSCDKQSTKPLVGAHGTPQMDPLGWEGRRVTPEKNCQ
jgi:hypothetical protein